MVEDIKLCNSFGVSDHVGMIFELPCDSERQQKENHPKFYKGNYVEIRKYLSNVPWQNMRDMSEC